MKKKFLFKIALLIIICSINFNSFSQGTCSVTIGQTSEFSSLGDTQAVSLNFNPILGCIGNLQFTTPEWISIQQTGTQLLITCSENQTPFSRNAQVSYSLESSGLFGVIYINQAVGAYQYYYLDTDRDGFGNFNDYNPISSDVEVNGRVPNNLDYCIEEAYTGNNGCEPGYVHEDRNWTQTEAFDINGNLKAKSKSYFDDLGKGEQIQTLDLKTNKVWAMQTLFDAQGRPALQTLSAPINDTGIILHDDDFIKNDSGTNYSSEDFELDSEDPSEVGPAENTLGHYYSISNQDPENVEEKFKGNNYQDVTQYPFSRTIYSELNPGSTLRVLGGNKVDTDGNSEPDTWLNGYTFSMQASRELSQSDAFNDIVYNTIKTIKTVSRDVHGVENVVFTDTDGKTLAAARSGGVEARPMEVTIREQGYVDIHVPENENAKGFTINGVSGITTEVYNLLTEETTTTATEGLTNGFYRVSITNLDDYDPENNPVTISYKENYYDYSLNEYDEADRLITSYQPLDKLKSEFKYDALGQLIYSKTPDEGETKFKYRKDGQIRFSQNAQQYAFGRTFSYTDYDEYGRPIESGVYQPLVPKIYPQPNPFETMDPDAPLPTGLGIVKYEQQFTTYDEPDEDGLSSVIATIYMGDFPKQRFTAGNVSKTSNENTTTWYSYDVYGRVEWMVQDIKDLGVKTIHYNYDPITGNVLKVDYQKLVSSERYVHHYIYNEVDELIEVKSSFNGDDNSAISQAKYYYYETGALRRIELANNLQGIDYIYNLAGQLKAINHPSGQVSNDPGNDSTSTNGFEPDVFSMSLDYYKGDYNRPNTPTSINSVTDGTDQFNGNIKAMTWYNKHPNSVPTAQTYYYDYNKNNWLEGAGLNIPVKSSGVGNDSITRSTVVTADEALVARQSITLFPGFHVQAGTNFTAKIDINTKATSAGDYNVYDITYDANGNIQTLNRNKQLDQGTNSMDQLTYEYYDDPNATHYAPNQLKKVSDAVGAVNGANDIGDQLAAENYKYNAIGQLVEDWENITRAELNTYNSTGTVPNSVIRYLYNASGLVTDVMRGDYQPIIRFFYNDKGYRVRKEAYDTNGNLTDTDHYIRDASGNALAIYKNGVQTELPIYGSGRIGVHYKSGNIDRYQLTDHLGNVRAVIARGGTEPSTTRDYYPFGMPMPGKENIGGEQYRYTYQGQEKDPETGKEAFQLRLWDGRIGRWLSTDPYYQFFSPYTGQGNDPVNNIDPDGGKSYWHWENGVLVSDDGDNEVTLAEFLGIGLDFAAEIIAGEGFLIDFNNGDGTGLAEGQVARGDYSIFRRDTNFPKDPWRNKGPGGYYWFGCKSCHNPDGAYYAQMEIYGWHDFANLIFWQSFGGGIGNALTKVFSKAPPSVFTVTNQSSSKTQVIVNSGKAGEFYKTLNPGWNGTLPKVGYESFKTLNGTRVLLYPAKLSNQNQATIKIIDRKGYQLIMRYIEGL